MIVRRVVPIGTSTRPVFSIHPVTEKVFVPVLFPVPIVRNHFPPLTIMPGRLAYVSTLLSTVGFPHRPWSTVLGGLTLGIPLCPSIDAVRALPSPHTNAPAPLLMCRWNEKPVPKMESPSSPLSSICPMACLNLATDNGYSART